MNKIKTVLTLTLAIALSLRVIANNEFPDHHWQPVVTAHNMTATFSIRINGVLQSSPDLEMGVFAGEVCRSSFHLVEFPFIPGQFITEGYNIYGEEGEVLTFRLYDHGTEREMDVVTDYTLPWVANGIVGNAQYPQAIDFFSVTSNYYVLITDESQLVAGRSYLIATGFDETVKAMGTQGSGERVAADITCANRKAYLAPGLNSDACEFTLGGETGSWIFYDAVEEGYIATNGNGDLLTKTTVDEAAQWVVTVNPSGAAKLSNVNWETYVTYDDGVGDDENPAFYCDNEPYSLYLLAKCELVNGSVASLSVSDPSEMYVVESGNTLTVVDLSTVNVSNLIIEDGAQLINASEGVLATMQKAVTGYNDVTVSDGWYTLASPMVAAAVETGSNLVYPDYDLYAFDEINLTHEEWRNYKNNSNNNFTSFEAGRGYLYANGTTFTPIFKGTLNHTDVTFPLTYTDARPDELKGFNLIGNPFPHTIYKGVGAAIDDSRLASGYYMLTNSGEWIAKTYEDPILPGVGVLVQTSIAGNLSISKSTATATGESSSRIGTMSRLAIRLSDGTSQDVAYLYTNEGRGLVKINHFNTETPALSILQDNDKFAIAHVEEDCESVDIYFDNRRASTFTLVVNPMDWEGHYLHLIDNITGADVNLLRTPIYTFETTGKEYPLRFRLVLQGTDDPTEPFAFFDGSDWRVFNTGEATLQVMDVLGRMVSSETIDGNASINVSSLHTGVYVLRLMNGDEVRTQKIVIE